jgi:hypothetical protein
MKEICASLMQYCRYSYIVPHFGTCSATSAGSWVRSDWSARTGSAQPTGGVTIPPLDATVRLLGKYAYREKEDDDMDPFTLTYIYGAMKEKRQLKSLLVRSCVTAPLC